MKPPRLLLSSGNCDYMWHPLETPRIRKGLMTVKVINIIFFILIQNSLVIYNLRMSLLPTLLFSVP